MKEAINTGLDVTTAYTNKVGATMTRKAIARQLQRQGVKYADDIAKGVVKGVSRLLLPVAIIMEANDNPLNAGEPYFTQRKIENADAAVFEEINRHARDIIRKTPKQKRRYYIPDQCHHLMSMLKNPEKISKRQVHKTSK